MRRLLSVPLAAVVCLLASSVALAAPPAHERVATLPIEFAAGDMCAFPLRVAVTDEVSTTTTFAAARDGSQRILTRGVATNVATNMATGETLERTGGYRILITIAPDGSAVAHGTGALYAYYFVGDPGPLGPGFHAINGSVRERYGADGTLLSSTFSGSSFDLCEALA